MNMATEGAGLRAVGEDKGIERAWKVEDVCALTGFKRSWVYEQVELNLEGGLPFKRVGSRIRFDPVQVRAWWAAQTPVVGSKPKKSREN